VRITSEAATIPKMAMMVARCRRLVDSHMGNVSTNAPSTTHRATRPHTTSGRRRISRGTGRASRVACQVLEASLSTRPVPGFRRVTSRPTSTITNTTAAL
jgi:hypothetical protein